MALAALHNLVSGWRGLAGHRALLINLKAALLVHEGAAVDYERREALVTHAAISRGTGAALTHTLMLFFQQGLYFLLCKTYSGKIQVNMRPNELI